MEELLLGRGRMEAGGPPCSLLFPCQPCSIYWQEECGASEIRPPGCSSSCGFPRPGSPHGLLSSARKDQGWEEQRANIAFSLVTGRGAALPGASLCFGLQRVIRVTKEHIKYCAHAACLPFRLPIEKLISLLTCGQSNPSENALQIPSQSTMLPGMGWDGSTSSCPSKCPGNQGAAAKGIHGNHQHLGSWFDAQRCASLFLVHPFFPCPLGVEENLLGKALVFPKYGNHTASFCHVCS